MEYRKIGNTEIELSIFGLGCWSFGGGEYWGMEHDQKIIDQVVSHAVDLGVNYFDTAEVYNEGRSESSLGLALKNVQREKVIVGTKIAPSNCYSGQITKHCEASLSKLNTDYIDIYMLQWPIHAHSIRHFTHDQNLIDNPPSQDETIEELLKLQSAGKIRHIGVSNHSTRRLTSFSADTSIVINQLPYNLLSRAVEYEVLPYCKSRGIGVIGYSSLMQGILADVYPDIMSIPDMLKRTRHFDNNGNTKSRHGEHGFEKEVTESLNAIRKIAKENEISMADLSLKWAVANDAISSSLVGVRNVKRLEANIKAINESIDSNIINALSQVTDTLKEKLGNYLDYYEGAINDRT
jgi:myo-inositol catabolism protein IolS